MVVDCDNEMMDLLIESTHGKIDWDLIWVQYPGKYIYASTFGTYGNEPSTDCCYVAGAVVVSLPAIGAGVRESVG